MAGMCKELLMVFDGLKVLLELQDDPISGHDEVGIKLYSVHAPSSATCQMTFRGAITSKYQTATNSTIAWSRFLCVHVRCYNRHAALANSSEWLTVLMHFANCIFCTCMQSL